MYLRISLGVWICNYLISYSKISLSIAVLYWTLYFSSIDLLKFWELISLYKPSDDPYDPC